MRRDPLSSRVSSPALSLLRHQLPHHLAKMRQLSPERRPLSALVGVSAGT